MKQRRKIEIVPLISALVVSAFGVLMMWMKQKYGEVPETMIVAEIVLILALSLIYLMWR